MTVDLTVVYKIFYREDTQKVNANVTKSCISANQTCIPAIHFLKPISEDLCIFSPGCIIGPSDSLWIDDAINDLNDGGHVTALPGQQVQDLLPHVGAARSVIVDQLRGQLGPPGASRVLLVLDPVHHPALVVEGGEVAPQHGGVTGGHL